MQAILSNGPPGPFSPGAVAAEAVAGLVSLSGLAKPCPQHFETSFPDVICMQQYGAVLPEDFERPISGVVGHADTYGSTFVPADNTFQHVANASFLIWDLERAVGVLGTRPRVEVHFSVDNLPHEGPVYEPNLDVLFFSRLRPDPPSQYVVDLGVEPPTLSRRTFDPPVVAPCGATYHDGLVYFCGSATRSGKYVPGVYALNATTGKVWPIVNNYFGYNFGTCDDLAVAPNGDIWFTDNCKNACSPHRILLTHTHIFGF
jgi:hypothetical protein